ncbi:MAG: hypothetical protein WCY59_08985, partial [Anaerovoracaceae bacterium]
MSYRKNKSKKHQKNNKTYKYGSVYAALRARNWPLRTIRRKGQLKPSTRLARIIFSFFGTG